MNNLIAETEDEKRSESRAKGEEAESKKRLLDADKVLGCAALNNASNSNDSSEDGPLKVKIGKREAHGGLNTELRSKLISSIVMNRHILRTTVK